MSRPGVPSAAAPLASDAWSGPLLAGVVLALVVPRLVLLAAGPDAHLSLMVDDASYYLEAARRAVATGAWPNTDGMHPTNGFHPLYMGLLMLVQRLFGEAPRTVLPVVFALNLALNAGAIAVLVRVLRRRAGRGFAAAALVLALDPGWLLHGTLAVENGLSSLLLLAVVLRWDARFGEDAPQAAWRARAIDGVLLGLAILGRTDAALWAFGYGLGALVVVTRARGLRAACVEVGAIALVAALVVAPWAIANLRLFGTLAQDSAAALALRYGLDQGPRLSPGGLRAAAMSVGFWLFRFLWAGGLVPVTAWLWGRILPLDRFRAPSRTTIAGAFVMALAVVAMLLRANDTTDIRDGRIAALEMGLGTLGLVAGLISARAEGARWRPVHTLVVGVTLLDVMAYAVGFRGFQVWYATGPSLACVLLVASEAMPGALAGRRALATALVALMAVQCGLTVRDALARGGIEGMDRHILAEGEALRGRLEAFVADSPTPVVFGSFDSGELAYRIHPFPVINLDGVMNHEAAVAIQHRALAAYMRRVGVTHLLTSPLRIEQYRRVDPFAATFDSAATARLGLSVWVLGRDTTAVAR